MVALDFPGFGWSDQPADLSFDLYPRVVLGLMDELGLDRPSLVGNSMGGAVGALVAASHPSRVEQLVLIDAAGFNLRAADRPAMVRLTAHPLAEGLLARLPIRRLLVTLGLRQVFHDDTKITDERVNEYLAAASAPGHPRFHPLPGGFAASRPASLRGRAPDASWLPTLSSGARKTPGSRPPTPTGSWPPSRAPAR